MADKNKTKEGIRWYIPFSLFAGILFIYIVFWIITDHLILSPDERGVFGDKFGAVNALFSGLAFAGLIITLILQKKELTLQREELEETRNELKNQREEFERENATLKYQRFENLLYNMFNLQQEIVAGLHYTYETKEEVKVPVGDSFVMDDRHIEHIVTGRDLFRFAFEEMQIPIAGGTIKSINGFRHYLMIKGCSQYGASWVPTYYDHYFRHLYRILKFIDEQGFSQDEAYKYTSLLRGTLSRYELVWIYYNCLNPDNAKLKAFVEKYSILKNLRKELLAKNLEYKQFLEQKGESDGELRNRGLYVTDYDYYLSDNKDDPDRLYVGAFYNSGDILEGLEEVNRIKSILV